jgi:putative transposase
MGKTFHELAAWKGVKIVEGQLVPDHVHMCLIIPSKFSVSNIVGYLKGKSAISIGGLGISLIGYEVGDFSEC